MTSNGRPGGGSLLFFLPVVYIVVRALSREREDI
jgi:hypothetical protein